MAKTFSGPVGAVGPVAVEAAAFGADIAGQAGRAAAGLVGNRLRCLLIAEDAVQRGADPVRPTECRQRPGALLERRLVTDMLAVSALESAPPQSPTSSVSNPTMARSIR